MRYFSTFTGIGGFELGIYDAYRETLRRKQADTSGNDEARERLVATQGESAGTANGRPSAGLADLLDERPLCVGYSEIDKYAISVYEYQFKGTKNYGDITKINAEQLPDFDCLVGGFPCQAFSIAGKRRGFEDTRGTLFFDLARILRAKQPRLFVFENVKGLLSHDDGRTFKTIIKTIDELGYDCQWQVLNSKNHGVPQNRERVIIVGHLRGTPWPQVFPISGADSKDLITLNQDRHDYNRVYDSEGIAPALNTGGLHDIAPTLTGKSYQDNNHIISKTVRAGGRNSPHGSKQSWDSYLVDGVIRRLTPLECERLQGFPDNWTKFGVDEADNVILISDTQRYKMCGNAVTVNVIEAVFERIFDSKIKSDEG